MSDWGPRGPGGMVWSVEGVAEWRRTIQTRGLMQERGVGMACGRSRAESWHRSVRVRQGR